MNRAGVMHAILVAIALTVAGALVFAVLTPFAGKALALRLAWLAVGAGCLGDLLLRHGARGGRLLLGAIGCAAFALLLLFDPALWAWPAALALLLWSGRCLLLHRRPLVAAIDAALGAFAVLAALATLRHSGSAWLALWCFLLAQALSALLVAPASSESSPAQRFDAARRAAEASLQQLSHPWSS
jgi:hypothetical protein